jgi:hypothetical protein
LAVESSLRAFASKVAATESFSPRGDVTLTKREKKNINIRVHPRNGWKGGVRFFLVVGLGVLEGVRRLRLASLEYSPCSEVQHVQENMEVGLCLYQHHIQKEKNIYKERRERERITHTQREIKAEKERERQSAYVDLLSRNSGVLDEGLHVPRQVLPRLTHTRTTLPTKAKKKKKAAADLE